MVLSTALDQYFYQTISHSLGLPVPQDFLVQKLNQVEDSKRDLEAQVYSLQRRTLDLQHQIDRARGEASLTAVALRRHVAENQKVVGQFKQISQQCAWLEDECSLYFNDREVFMGVADEAEERAFKAEERAMDAEKKVAELLSEVDSLKQVKMEHTRCEEDILTLKSKVIQLESEKSSLQVELVAVKSTAKMNPDVMKTDTQLENMGITATLENAGLCSRKAEEYVTMASQPSSDIDKKELELWIYKERQGIFEHQLMAEVQRLWQEIALYKCNLAKAEIQIQILADDNKDLRSALRNQSSKSPTRHSKDARIGSLKLQKRPPSDLLGHENSQRQPLFPVQPNLLNLNLQSTHPGC